MRKIMIVNAGLLALSCIASCTITSGKSADDTTGNEATSPRHVSWRDYNLKPGTLRDDSLVQSGDTIGYIAGKFGKTDHDTLYCIAVGCRWYNPNPAPDDIQFNHFDTYRFTNKRLGLEDLVLTSKPFLQYVKTSELDGDGMDEIQFHAPWYWSCWQSYIAIDYYNGHWVMLTRPVTFYRCNEDDSDSTYIFVDYTDMDPGKIYVYEDEFLPKEDPMEIIRIPKIIPIDRQPIKHEYDTCYSLPGGEPILLPVKKQQVGR